MSGCASWLRGYSTYDRIRFYVFAHHGTGGNHGTTTDGYALRNDRAGPDPGFIFNDDWFCPRTSSFSGHVFKAVIHGLKHDTGAYPDIFTNDYFVFRHSESDIRVKK